MIQAITIEREFGCGGSDIAAKLSDLLGWKLRDHELIQEIARLTNSEINAQDFCSLWKRWRARRDSNSRPSGSKTRALLGARSYDSTFVLTTKHLVPTRACVQMCPDMRV
jgi:hypothetical protein